MNRRDLLKTAFTAGAATLLASGTAWSKEEDDGSDFRVVDTNVSLFRWPFRRLPLDDPDTLREKLRALGIAEAWAGSFEAILHRDMAGVNRRLAGVCSRLPGFVPIGSVNPELPDWKDDLRRCVEEHNMPGIRLLPNYHGYALDDPRFARLLERATEAGVFVQIAAGLEDTRTQHPMLTAPDLDLSPLVEVLTAHPGARVQILNHRGRSASLAKLAEAPGVYFDTARVDGTDGVPNFMRKVSAGRVMFGSHAPFLIPEAALIRVHESGQLGEQELRALLSANARQEFRKGKRQ